MGAVDATGLVWDTVPLLEEIASFGGRPGGMLGLDYFYVPVDLVFEVTSEDPPTTHPHTGRTLSTVRPKDGGPTEQEMWAWRPASSKVFRCTNGGKTVDWQVLERGVPVPQGPGWYRCRTQVHPAILLRVDWEKDEHDLLGTVPPAMAAAAKVPAARPTPQAGAAAQGAR